MRESPSSDSTDSPNSSDSSASSNAAAPGFFRNLAQVEIITPAGRLYLSTYTLADHLIRLVHTCLQCAQAYWGSPDTLSGLLFTTIADAAHDAPQSVDAPGIGLQVYQETNLLISLDLPAQQITLHTMLQPHAARTMSLVVFVDEYFNAAEL